jgi:predicted DNA-binding transcriptional regulator AlpA
MHTNENYVKLNDPLQIVPVSKSSILRLVAAQRFPAPRKLGGTMYWIRGEVESFLNSAPRSPDAHT